MGAQVSGAMGPLRASLAELLWETREILVERAVCPRQPWASAPNEIRALAEGLIDRCID